MELWLDTADIPAIKQKNALGILHGVTTNPSIFAHAGKNAEPLIEALLESQSGLVALQVTRTHSLKEMVAQAQQIARLSPRIVIKIPATPLGFAAMSELSKYQVPVLATAVSSISQFSFAVLAGADYAALYLSHMQKAGKDILTEITQMLSLIEKHDWSIKLMGAAFADAATAQAVIACGVQAITVPDAILSELLAVDPLVQHQLQKFESDWQHYQENHQADLLQS